MTDYNEEAWSKWEPDRHSCLRTLLIIFVGVTLCGLVAGVSFMLFAPRIINRVFGPEIIYVEPDFSIDVQPVDVAYHLPMYPAYGGVFENGVYFQVDTQTVNVTIADGTAAVEHVLTVSNLGSEPVEGVFIIPLPADPVLDNVQVEIGDEPAHITPYNTIEGGERLQTLAQEHDDPVLLAYADRPFVEADVFPLDESQTVTVTYTTPTDMINGLVALDMPLAFPISTDHPVEEFNVTVSAAEDTPLRNIYPASLDLTIKQSEPTAFTGSATLSDYTPPQNLDLYYARSDAAITANVITYRENDTEDGYFLFLAEPAPVTDSQIVAKDVVLVLDQSGSMEGMKWQQAQDAASYVLEHLNHRDRFFITTFSTSYSLFDNTLSDASTASDAITWVNGRTAAGGTNINLALLETLRRTDPERPTTLLFMTDGQATEGVTETQEILQNLREAVGENVRIFVFGVGDDVNTLLLDSIASEYRGETGYVRPSETIDVEISTLYAKISAPILTNIQVDFGDAVAGDFVPAGQLPDLYEGEQLLLVGRYRRGGDDLTLTLTGTVNGEAQTYTFTDLAFADTRGGQPFVARLWAARFIGAMLNTIRLGNETSELVDSIVALSLRYGIITPYTEFLLEQEDVLTTVGQQAASSQMLLNTTDLQRNQTGASAVDSADKLNQLSSSRYFVTTPSYGSSGKGRYYYYEPQTVEITPTPLPELSQDGLLLTIKRSEKARQTAETQTPGGSAIPNYVMSLNEDALDRVLRILPDSIAVESPAELPVLISNLVNTYGLEEGIQIYNETFGIYLPMLTVDNAQADTGYTIAPELDFGRPPLRTVQEKTFILQDGVYTDTTFMPDTMEPEIILRESANYDALLARSPDMVPYLSVGTPLIIVWEDGVYAIQSDQ